MRRAIIYARYSPRPKQRNAAGELVDPDALDRQFGLLQAECDKHNLVYAQEWSFSDADKSGDDADRPGLWAAVSAIRPGDVFMARDVERIARSPMLMAFLEEVIEGSGGEIVTLELGYSATNDQATIRFMRAIIAAVGEFQRWIIAARSKASALREFAAGRWRWSRDTVPYGWRVRDCPENEGRKCGVLIEPVESEQQTILVLQHYYQEEGLSRAKTARMLNQHGHAWREGKPWNSDRVKHVLNRIEGANKSERSKGRSLRLRPGQLPILAQVARRKRGNRFRWGKERS